MRKYNKTNRAAKGMAALVMMSCMLMNVTPAFAAEEGQADAIVEEDLAVVQDSEENDAIAELNELFFPGSEDDSYVNWEYSVDDGIMPILDPGEFKTEVWTISPGTRHLADKIYLKEGQNVGMSCTIVPGTVTSWLGLMKDSNGDCKCVQGTGALGYSVDAWKTGYYRPFVQNRGDETITAYITYIYN